MLLSYAFILLFAAACKKNMYTSLNSEEDNVIETSLPVHTPVTHRISANVGGYYEALPARYDSTRKKYPLILFLHGIGELGNGSTDLPKMVRTGLPGLINRKKFPASFESNGGHFSFIVISPQFSKRPANDEVKQVLEAIIKKIQGRHLPYLCYRPQPGWGRNLGICCTVRTFGCGCCADLWRLQA